MKAIALSLLLASTPVMADLTMPGAPSVTTAPAAPAIVQEGDMMILSDPPQYVLTSQHQQQQQAAAFWGGTIFGVVISLALVSFVGTKMVGN